MDVEHDNLYPFDLEVSNKACKMPPVIPNHILNHIPSPKKTHISDLSNPSLQEYITNYHGEVKVDRLVAIADVYGRSALSITALTSAVAELRHSTKDTSRYLGLIDRLSQLGESHPIDREWVDSTEQTASSLFSTIDSDLNQAKSAMDKTAIRAAYMAMGNFCYTRGDFQAAFKNYLRTRDYSTDALETIESCLAVLKGSTITKSYAHVGNYVSRGDNQFAELTMMTTMMMRNGSGMYIDPEEAAAAAAAGGGGGGGNNGKNNAISRMKYALNDKITATAGLAQLSNGKFLAAARHFTSISPDLIDELSPPSHTLSSSNNKSTTTEEEEQEQGGGNGVSSAAYGWNRLLAPRDIALYGVLCALASFERVELACKVVESPTFAPYLETLPQIKEAAHGFYNHNYRSSLETLDALLPVLRADIHLQQHLEPLYQQIRWKAMRQYTAPFSTLDLNSMAVEFGRDVAGIEQELAELISGGKIQAKIDSHAKILYASKQDVRSEMYKAAVQASEGCIRDGKALLLRASMLKNNVVQRRGGGGIGGSGGMMGLPDRGERETRGGRHRGEREKERSGGSGRDKGGSGGEMA